MVTENFTYTKKLITTAKYCYRESQYISRKTYKPSKVGQNDLVTQLTQTHSF